MSIRRIWYDNPASLIQGISSRLITNDPQLFASQGANHSLVYYLGDQTSEAAIATNLIAYANRMRAVLEEQAVVATCPELPPFALERAYNPDNGLSTTEKDTWKARVRAFVIAIWQAFPPARGMDRSLFNWIGPWYIIDEPGLSNTTAGDKSWATALILLQIAKDVRKWEAEAAGEDPSVFRYFRPQAILFHPKTILPASPGGTSLFLDCLAEGLGQFVKLWLTFDYPVGRYRKQQPLGEFAADLTRSVGFYSYFSAKVLADPLVGEEGEVGLVSQAFGYDPPFFLVSGLPNGSYQNEYGQISLREDRHQTFYSLIRGNFKIVSRFTHYYNTHERHGSIFGPVLQEIEALEPEIQYIATPATQLAVSNPAPADAESPSRIEITYEKVRVQRYTESWTTLWTPTTFPFSLKPAFILNGAPSDPMIPNDGHFGPTESEGQGPLGPLFGLDGELDLALGITLSKTSSILGARALFSVLTADGGTHRFDFAQSLQDWDPIDPGVTVPWDGIGESHEVIYPLKAIRTGLNKGPMPRLMGSILDLKLYAQPLPVFWSEPRVNFPQVAEEPFLLRPGSNDGVWYTLRKPSATSLISWLIMVNCSGLRCPASAPQSLTIPLSVLGGTGLTSAKISLFQVPIANAIYAVGGGNATFQLGPLDPYEVQLIRIVASP